MASSSSNKMDLISISSSAGSSPSSMIRDKLGEGTAQTLVALLCLWCGLPLIDARQTYCGCRICSSCYHSLLESPTHDFVCKKCDGDFNINETFIDRAVVHELKRVSFPCYNEKCPWEGSNVDYRDHILRCRYTPIVCPHEGCDYALEKEVLDKHIKNCPFKPITCRHCGKKTPSKYIKEHLQECENLPVLCEAGCGEKVPRSSMKEHLENSCRSQLRHCKYFINGCTFKGNLDQLTRHEQSDVKNHLQLVATMINDRSVVRPTSSEISHEMKRKLEEIDRRQSQLNLEFMQITNDYNLRIHSIMEDINHLQTTVQSFQESFQELALLVQTLQATSYTGQFIWKIPELTRRREEAKSGKTLSLYSAPFYTSRFGYKLCLRLYLDGDGSGKGTHLSFFLTIMKGEYDSLLPWPFSQMVTLMLLDQDNKKHIIQCFKPEPSSSSFWKPQTEMNVASGCPKFAPLSVLSNLAYARDDTLYFKCIIDTTGLTQP